MSFADAGRINYWANPAVPALEENCYCDPPTNQYPGVHFRHDGVELLAADDYQGALEALHWPKGTSWTPEELKGRVTTFFGGDTPWSVVVPNDRLIGVINDAAEFQPRNREGWGWFMAQVPLTTEPTDPKNDEIPLMGLASSFFVRELGGKYVLEGAGAGGILGQQGQATV
jgi:hypothetical protein